MLTNKEVNFHFQMDTGEDGPKGKNVPWSRLVVPLRMRSKYWKYFGFPADEKGTIVSKDKIVCLLCKVQMIYNRNTSNLRMHLVSKHKNLAKKIDPEFVKTVKEKTPVNSSKKKKNNLFARNSDGSLDFQNVDPPLGSTSKNNKNAARDATREVHLLMSDDSNENDVSNIAIIFPNQDELMQYSEPKDAEESEESNEVYNTLIKFVVNDLVSPSILDGKGFRGLISHLSPRAMFISYEKKLTNELIPNVMQMAKQKMFQHLVGEAITNVSLSIEEWTCADKVKCVSIYIHYIQCENATMHAKLLSTVDMTGAETNDYWNSLLDNLFTEWGFDACVFAAVSVSTSNEDLKDTLRSKGLIVMPCFLRVIQDICDKHVFSRREVQPLLDKCRKIVRFVKDNQLNLVDEFSLNEENDVGEEEEEEEDVDYPLNIDSEHLWLTTYFMLRNLSRKKNSFNETIQSIGHSVISSILPTATEWRCISDLVSLLEPFKIAVITVFEEKFPLVSLVKPLIWKLVSTKFEVNPSDSPMISEMKINIRNDLSHVYVDNDVDNFTKIATILDPRFKAFVEADNEFHTTTVLSDLLRNFGLIEGGCNLQSAGTPTKKASRSSGINALFGDISTAKSSMSSDDKIKTEVTHYQSISSPSLEESPLEWWRQMVKRCPNLSKLANKYHCVPSILSHGNTNLLDYIKFCQKRSALDISIVDPMLFLHYNHCV